MAQSRFPRGSEVRGLAFPLTKGHEGYFPRRNAGALRQSSLIMILGTRKGERVMLPDFGSNLDRLLFEPNDVLLVQQVKEETADAITRWDSNLVVIGIAPEINDDTMRIYIDYYDKREVNQNTRRTVLTLGRV